MSVHPKSKLHELGGVASVAASILLILSLVSHNALDPSLNVSSAVERYANYCGKVGAWMSDSLFQILGLAAFCVPLPLLFVGYRKIRSRPLEYPFLKLFACFCILLSLSAGFSLLAPQVPGTVNFTPGGVLGVLISDYLLKYFNAPGALVVVTTVLVLALVLTTRFSVDATLTWIGERNWNVFSGLAANYRQWRKRRRERKEALRLRNWKKTVVAQPVPPKLGLERAAAAEPAVVEAPKEEIGEEVGQKLRFPAKPRDPQEERLTTDQEPAPPPTIGISSPRPVPAHPAPRPEPKLEGSRLPHIARPYQLPSLDFLQAAAEQSAIDEQELLERAEKLATKCSEFGVLGRVLQIHPGPVVTTYEFKPDPGVKYSRITNLADDLCLGLKAESVRIDRIPGKNTVGIEVPNLHRQHIFLREILASAAFQESRSLLTLALGKLINGNTYVTDLNRMPHLLIAGATGSGKSVALNIMVCSILYKPGPAEVRFIMIDPKRLELGVYEGIPHLLTPIVTDPRQAANALNWAVNEMEDRYQLLAQHGVRNIDQFNQLMNASSSQFEEDDERGPLPYIVIIVDELADLMMTAGKEVEASLTRLAQMARAIGIHLILATQRPSVDVLTGLIKANFPARISFRVSSKVDSRTILDCNGAEQLLGQGDMLFLPPGTSRLVRIHGAYISEKEIKNITEFLKKQAEPEYQEQILGGVEETDSVLVDVGDLDDELYEEAGRCVVETGKASTSLLQRRLRIGYGRAARLLDMMEHQGLIGPPDGSKARDVLVPPDYFDEVRRRKD